MDKIALARAIATVMHNGQMDKGGAPYIGHPESVSKMVSGESEKVTAWLHDFLEDTDFPPEGIRAIFGDEIADAVEVITRRNGESYQDYLARVAQNDIARKVKIADLTHNSDLSRIPKPTGADLQRVKRYREYKAYLENFKKKQGL